MFAVKDCLERLNVVKHVSTTKRSRLELFEGLTWAVQCSLFVFVLSQLFEWLFGCSDGVPYIVDTQGRCLSFA